jgi:uncharacterized protein (DUF433 family)
LEILLGERLSVIIFKIIFEICFIRILCYIWTSSDDISSPLKSKNVLKGYIQMKRKLLGRYIVADPEICHGKPTFIGTRIMVSQVLEQVASGMVWEAIIDEWRGSINKEAIAEAVRLASQAFYEHADDFALELTSE